MRCRTVIPVQVESDTARPPLSDEDKWGLDSNLQVIFKGPNGWERELVFENRWCRHERGHDGPHEPGDEIHQPGAQP